MKRGLSEEGSLEPTFETQDIQLAAALFALGANLLAINRSDSARCAFVFADSSDIRRMVEAFWHRQLSFEPQALLSALKAVKSRLYGDRV